MQMEYSASNSRNEDENKFISNDSVDKSPNMEHKYTKNNMNNTGYEVKFGPS